jgi:hypothetical protein
MRADHHRLPLWVALLLAGIFLLTTGGHTYATDEEQLFAVAESLLTRGSFVIGTAEDGRPRYSIYGPAQPVLATPLLALGRAVAALFPPEGYALVTRAAVSWFNPLVTAATGGLLALAALRLGYGAWPAAGVALIYGLATFAWPHSKSFFSEPLAAALTFASFVVALGARRPVSLSFSGLLAGLACAVKIQAGLALPFLGLWVLWSARERAGWGSTLRAGLAWGLGALLGLGALALYQWALFGDPLRSGYGSTGGVTAILTNPLGEGLYGLVLSPGKGLIWYAPPLLLLPAGLALLWRRDRGVAALCGAITLATLLFYAKLIFWHGDGAWGPRYLNMALPFMALPLVALLAAGRPARLALLLTLALAVPVQLGALAISLNAYLGVQPDAQRRYFEPSQSPIAGHLRLAAQQLATSYNLRLAPGRLVLAEGFSYSEGDRAAGVQLPRWTLPEARLLLRPPPGATAVRLELGLAGCLPAPLAPRTLSLALNGVLHGDIVACPPRRVALLLPGERAELRLATAGWQPEEVGIPRAGPLGVSLGHAAAWADGAPLPLAGRLVPIPPMPAGPTAQRLWSSDYRHAHWDHWAWYLAHSGLPARPSWALALAWLAVALALIVAGALGLRAALRTSVPARSLQSPHSTIAHRKP